MTSMFSKYFYILLQSLIVVSLCSGVVVADKNSISGFVDVNIYPYLTDTNNDNFLTINAAANIGSRLSYFSLSNFGNRPGPVSSTRENTFFTEQNLRWKFTEKSPLDLTVQLNFRTGDNNDRYRFGVRWRLNDTEFLSSLFDSLHLAYSINWHAVQIDHEDARVWQLEHVFKFNFPYLSDRLYLAGFADHTFNQDLPANFPKNPIVGEAQLGFRLYDSFFAVSEYRINEFRRSDVDNLAIGVQYKASW